MAIGAAGVSARASIVAALAVGALLVSPAPAAAQVEHHYDRAFAYWHVPGLDVARCPSGPEAIYDEPKTRAAGAIALGELGGCLWWYGDLFLALTEAERCDTETHELGHLLGLGHGLGDPRDPLGVMGQPFDVPECASLNPPPVPPAVAPAAPVVAVAPVRSPWQARAACVARADRRRTGALRRLGRLTCGDRYRAAVRHR